MLCEARGLDHYSLEWFRRLTQIRENGLRQHSLDLKDDRTATMALDWEHGRKASIA